MHFFGWLHHSQALNGWQMFIWIHQNSYFTFLLLLNFVVIELRLSGYDGAKTFLGWWNSVKPIPHYFNVEWLQFSTDKIKLLYAYKCIMLCQNVKTNILWFNFTISDKPELWMNKYKINKGLFYHIGFNLIFNHLTTKLLR